MDSQCWSTNSWTLEQIFETFKLAGSTSGFWRRSGRTLLSARGWPTTELPAKLFLLLSLLLLLVVVVSCGCLWLFCVVVVVLMFLRGWKNTEFPVKLLLLLSLLMLLLSLVVIVVVLSCTCCSVVFERMANY